MRILAFSDLHHSAPRAAMLVAASAEADLVVGAGDFCNMRRDLADAMAPFAALDVPFVVVPGNAESADELRRAAPQGTTVLHGEAAEIGGLRIFGLGYGVPVTPFGAWSCDLSEAEAETRLAACSEADLMVFHSPPKGIADQTSQGRSVGSTAIRAAIERVGPQLAVCGHIHDSWGQTGEIGGTRVVNLGPTPNLFDLAPRATEGAP